MKENTMVLWLILACCIYQLGGDFWDWIVCFVIVKGWFVLID